MASRVDPKDIDLDYIKKEFKRFRGDLAGVKDKLSSDASDALEQISSYLDGGAISSRVATIEAELATLTGKMKGYGKEGVSKLESGIGERPLASIAIAFGVGLLASKLFSR